MICTDEEMIDGEAVDFLCNESDGLACFIRKDANIVHSSKNDS